jgi:hypothetical protein
LQFIPDIQVMPVVAGKVDGAAAILTAPSGQFFVVVDPLAPFRAIDVFMIGHESHRPAAERDNHKSMFRV